jgi:hypothetical protein
VATADCTAPHRLDRLERLLAERLDRLEAGVLEVLAELRGGPEEPARGETEERLLTVKEAAAELGRKPRWVYDHKAFLEARPLGPPGSRLGIPLSRIRELKARARREADESPVPEYLKRGATRRTHGQGRPRNQRS